MIDFRQTRSLELKMRRVLLGLLLVLCVGWWGAGYAQTQVRTALHMTLERNGGANDAVTVRVRVLALDGSVPGSVLLTELGTGLALATLWPDADGNVEYVARGLGRQAVLRAEFAGNAGRSGSSVVTQVSSAIPPGYSGDLGVEPEPSLVGQSALIELAARFGGRHSSAVPVTLRGVGIICTLDTTLGYDSCNYTFNKVGIYNLEVEFHSAGGSEYLSLDHRVVSASETDATLRAVPATIVLGQATTLVASTTSAYDGTLVPGSIVFREGGTVIGPGVSNGAATLVVSGLAVGQHTFFADFVPGSAKQDASTSKPTIVTVQNDDFTLGVPGNVLLQGAHHVELPVTIASLGIFADHIGMYCTNLPLYASCSFRPAAADLRAGGTFAGILYLDTDQVIGYAESGGGPLDAKRGMELGRALLMGIFAGRRRRLLRGTILSCLVGVGLVGTTSCTGKLPLHTPAGRYMIGVTATGATTGLSHTVPVTMEVTP